MVWTESARTRWVLLCVATVACAPGKGTLGVRGDTASTGDGTPATTVSAAGTGSATGTGGDTAPAGDTGPPDPCAASTAEATVRLGLDDGGFVPWNDGVDAPLDTDVRDTLGLPFAVEVRDLDQTRQLTALVDLYIGDIPVESGFGAILTTCTDGVGVGRSFLPLADLERDALVGREAVVDLTVIDAQERAVGAEVRVVLR